MFFGVRTAVDETNLGQFVALYGAYRTISWYMWTHYVRNNRRLSQNLLIYEPGPDDNLCSVGPLT